MTFDDALAASIEQSTADELVGTPRLTPTHGQRWLIDRVVAAVRDAGLDLPPLTWRFVSGRPGVCGGACEGDERGRIIVTLAVGPHIRAADLARTCCHELQHAADYNSGINYERVELEERAIVFAAKMMRRLEP